MQVRKLELLENKTDLIMNRYRSVSNHIKKRIKSQFEIIDNINKLCFSSPNFVIYETEKKSECTNLIIKFCFNKFLYNIKESIIH